MYGNIKNNLNKIIYCHSSSGYKQSLEEILSKPEIKKLIKEQYNVEYSHKQTWQILIKKLNFIIKSKKLIYFIPEFKVFNYKK